MKKKYILISIVALLVTFILLTLFVHPSLGKGTVSDFEELVRINRDANAIYFELVEDGRSYAFRYSFNKVSDGDSNGSNIKKINDNWLLIADE